MDYAEWYTPDRHTRNRTEPLTRRPADDVMGGPPIRAEHFGEEDPAALLRSVATDGAAVYAEVQRRNTAFESERLLWVWRAGRWETVSTMSAGQISQGPGRRLWQWSEGRCALLNEGIDIPVEGAPDGLHWLIRSCFMDGDACWAVAQLSTKTQVPFKSRQGWFRWRDEVYSATCGVGAMILRLHDGRWHADWQRVGEADPRHARIPDAMDGVPGGTGVVWAAGGSGMVLRRSPHSGVWEEVVGLYVPGDDGSHAVETVSACPDGMALIAGRHCVRLHEKVIEEIGCVDALGLDSLVSSWRTADGANWFVGRASGRTSVLRHAGHVWSHAVVAGWEPGTCIGAVPVAGSAVILVHRDGRLCRVST